MMVRLGPATLLFGVSLIAQLVKNPPAMQETSVGFLLSSETSNVANLEGFGIM